MENQRTEYIQATEYERSKSFISFEDALQYTVAGKGHSRLKRTNMLERLNEKVRQREKVVRIFPNADSANRLIGAVLIAIHDE